MVLLQDLDVDSSGLKVQTVTYAVAGRVSAAQVAALPGRMTQMCADLPIVSVEPVYESSDEEPEAEHFHKDHFTIIGENRYLRFELSRQH